MGVIFFKSILKFRSIFVLFGLCCCSILLQPMPLTAKNACDAHQVLIVSSKEYSQNNKSAALNNAQVFSVEIADTAQKQAIGLMHRESMARSHGMLFLFGRPKPTSFWMKNTLIPLDMLFLNQEGVITKIHENAIPLDTTPIFGGNSVYAVLEVNGGLSRELGISEGDVILHSAFEGAYKLYCE